MEKRLKLDKKLTKLEAQVKKLIKENFSCEIEKGLFNKLLLKSLIAEKDAEDKRRKHYEASKKGNRKESYNAAIKLCEANNRCSDIKNRLDEVRERIYKNAYRLLSYPNNKSLNELEQEVAKENNKLIHNAMRFCEGVGRQIVDLATGRFELIIKASEGDKEAQEKVFKTLEKFAKHIKWQYRNIGMGLIIDGNQPNRNLKKRYKHTGISDADIYLAMMEAIKCWKKNKYISQMQWIRGRIRRKMEELKKHEFQKNKKIITVDNEKLHALKCNKRKKQNYSPQAEGFIWIEQAAERLSLSPQTLRNWDKDGIFKARRIKKPTRNGMKRYRVYKEEDMLSLRKIKDEQLSKRRHSVKGYFKRKAVAEKLGISTKTLSRMEKTGKISKVRRDVHGHRIYTVSDVKNIKKVLNK